MENSITAIAAVFMAGVISFLSPCVLPLVPGYVSYIAGESMAESATSRTLAVRVHAVGLSACFVLGFGTIFVILGASATAVGQALLSYRYELNLVSGAVVIAFGLFVTGLLRPSWLQRDFRFDIVFPGGRPVAAYLLGMAFAFGWTPCIGPMLGAILTVSAASATVATGVTLLAIYSLGLGMPFLLVALFTGGLLARFRSIGRVGRLLHVLAGGVMVLMGAAMITGQLSTFSFWLLETFPKLSTIG
ncbi:MAG: cytochrome c biogenesis CcdA family protein [Bradyrhizobium sp.]